MRWLLALGPYNEMWQSQVEEQCNNLIECITPCLKYG